jgi:DNA-binding CsgD family transcriptional regulator
LFHIAEDAAAQTEYMWLTGEVDTERTVIFSDVLRELASLEGNLATDELAFWMWSIGQLGEIPDGVAEPYRLVMVGEPAASARMWHDLGYPYERAIALSNGDTDQQVEALGLLEKLGAHTVASKLHQALRDRGVPVPRLRRKVQPAAGLTPRQTEVLTLLADELTNAEIADRLFLSRRTVEHHVAAVMAKLGAKTRLEAVATATQQGLLTVG